MSAAGTGPFPAPREIVPHAAGMCLLTRIVSCSDTEIVCVAQSHRAADNPLRHANRLAALHLAEYGAQAMAVHGGLLEKGEAARGGLLAAIRDLTLHVERIDDIAADIEIHAVKLVANTGGRIYSFSARSAGAELARGRVSVMFAPAG